VKGERFMPSQVYKQEDILWIEMCMSTIQNDALGRYIHDPTNLSRIINVYRDVARHLLEVRTGLKCPPGYSHRDCSCTVDINVPPPSGPNL